MTSNVTVHTKAEFSEAKRQKVIEIEVLGDLADRLQKSKQIVCLGAGGLAVLAVAICILVAAVPSGFGLPFLSIFSAKAWAALEIAAVIAASVLCAALLLAVYIGYDEIEKAPGVLKLRRMTRR